MRPILVCAALLTAAAPALGQPAAHAPVPAPAAMSAAGTPSIDHEPVVGEALSLSMEDAVGMAFERGLRVKRMNRNVEISDLRLSSTRAMRLPRFDSYLNVNESARGGRYATPFYAGKYEPYATFQAGVTGIINAPIDVAGTTARQVQQAALANDSARLYQRQAMVDVGADVRIAYLDALRAQGAVDADEALAVDLARLVDRARQQRHPALSFLEVELANARQTLSAARSGAESAQTGLKQQLRLPLDTRLTLNTRLSAEAPKLDTLAALEKALAQRAEMRDARIRVQQAELAGEQVRDGRKPYVNVYAYFNESRTGPTASKYDDNRFQNWSVMVNVSVPLLYWDWGLLSNNARTAALSREQALDDITETEDRIRAEMRQLTSNLEQARRRLSALPRKDLAQQALDQAQEGLLKHQDWQAHMAQVSNARNVWRMTHTASIDALADYYTSYYRLKRAMGED